MADERNIKEKLSVSTRLSQWLGLLSIALLTLSPLLLIFMWVYAWRNDFLPEPNWENTRISGPWSGIVVLSKAWDEALFMPFYALLPAACSFILKPNKRAGIVLLLIIPCLTLVFLHVGLVED